MFFLVCNLFGVAFVDHLEKIVANLEVIDNAEWSLIIPGVKSICYGTVAW